MNNNNKLQNKTRRKETKKTVLVRSYSWGQITRRLTLTGLLILMFFNFRQTSYIVDHIDLFDDVRIDLRDKNDDDYNLQFEDSPIQIQIQMSTHVDVKPKPKAKAKAKAKEGENNKSKHSPVLILHVGPTKTGTSSIQCALQTSPFLNKSSYEYIDKYQTGCNPGKYPLTNKRLPNHAAAMQQIVFKRSNKSADLLKKSLKRSYSNNHNAIISAEELDAMEYKSEKTWDFLNEALLQPHLYQKRNTHVVVTYRHLHERFLSSYYENVVTRNMKDRWGKKIAVPFPEHFSTMIGDEEYYDRQLNLGRLIDAYERHSFNVTIFNFHGDGDDDDSEEEEDMVTRFLCQLPRAAATCEAYKNDLKNDANNYRSSGNSRSRSSMKSYSQYDRIAKTAYNMELFKQFNMTDINRLEVVQAIEYRMNSLGMKSYTDLPLDCVGDEELNTLLEMSIQNGRRVFKGRRTGTGITTYRQDDIIRTSFEAYKKRREFCSVDVDSLLKKRSWTHFFKHELKATVLSIRDQSRMRVMN